MIPAAERPLPYFQRIALIVDDLDKAFAVYRDLLGFELEYIADHESESFAYEIFEIPESVVIRFAARFKRLSNIYQPFGTVCSDSRDNAAFLDLF